MELTIRLDLIQETGYSTWYDFFQHIINYSKINDKCHYEYRNSEGTSKGIELGIDKTTLSYLAETELLISLKEAGYDSFSSFLERLVNQRQADVQTYQLEYIHVDKNKQVSLKKISFSPELIFSFANLEKKAGKLKIYTVSPSE